MSIIDSETLIALMVMFHAVAVLELRAVIHGDGLECAFRKLPDDLIQSSDSCYAGFCLRTEDDFVAGFAFGQCEY